MENQEEVTNNAIDIPDFLMNYRKTVINLVLVTLVFFLVVRPLLKGLRRMSAETTLKIGELTAGGVQAQIPESAEGGRKEKVLEISSKKPEKTQQLLKGWINE